MVAYKGWGVHASHGQAMPGPVVNKTDHKQPDVRVVGSSSNGLLRRNVLAVGGGTWIYEGEEDFDGAVGQTARQQ